MIVFISDTHFEDGSAGEHNLPPEAFRIFFEDMVWHIEHRGIEEVTLVLLGDIFDLLRSEYWLDPSLPDEGKPWAIPLPDAASLGVHAGAVLDGILRKNAAALAAFREGVETLRQACAKVTVVFVPGNHDRLVNHSEPLREQVRAALSVKGSGRFRNFFEDRDYGVHARHGHEFDIHNFANVGSFDEADYDAVPIGDPMTTEFLTRIPVLVEAMADKHGLSPTEVDIRKLKRNFQDIENVRPLSATIDWLLYQVQIQPELEAAIEDAVDEAVRYFKSLPFVKAWIERHDSWRNPWDEADQLQLAFWALERFKILSARELMPIVERVMNLSLGRDPLIDAAAELFSHLDPSICFVVLGHTHAAQQSAVALETIGGHQVRRMYLNSGTWRPRHRRCYVGNGFVDWKEMAYCIIYSADERRHSQGPTFETWSGTLAD